MKFKLRALAAGLGLISCGALQAESALLADGTLIAGRCDRACMTSLVDDYLLATVAHDPRKVQWTTLPRYTENGTLTTPGQGQLWLNTTGVGKYKNYYGDMKGGQIGFVGVIQIEQKPVLIGMRLKVTGRRIGEVEVLTVAKPGAAEALEARGSPPAIFQQPIAAGQRASRQQLIDIADAYFDGLERSNGDMVPFAPTCNRIENGGQTTNLTDLSQTPFADVPGSESWRVHFLKGCREQVNTGMFAYITELRNRRYEVIDEEKGNVLSFVVFAHPGDVKQVRLPGQPLIVQPANNRRAFDTYVAEGFHIHGGQLHQIEAAISVGISGMETGWPDRPRLDR